MTAGTSIRFVGFQTADCIREVLFHLKHDGVVVVPSLLSESELVGLRTEIADFRQRYPNPHKQGRSKTIFPTAAAYHRSLTETPRMCAFAAHPLLRGIARLFFGELGRTCYVCDILSIETDPRSEGITDWHVDMSSPDLDYHRDYRLKFHTYLNDVSKANGAFSYLPGTHRLHLRIREAMKSGLIPAETLHTAPDFIRYNADHHTALEKHAEIAGDLQRAAAYIAENPHADAYSIEAPAGSVIVFDERGIHRGGFVGAGQHRSILRVSYGQENVKDRNEFKGWLARRAFRIFLPKPYRDLM